MHFVYTDIRPAKPNILLERTRYGLHIEHDRWCLDICISIGAYLGTDNVHFLCMWQVTSQEAFNISDQRDPKLSQFLHSKDQRPYCLNNSLTFYLLCRMGIEFNTKNKILSLMGIVKNIYVCRPDLIQTPVEYVGLTTAGMESKGGGAKFSMQWRHVYRSDVIVYKLYGKFQWGYSVVTQ